MVYLASKLNYHRLKPVVLQEIARLGSLKLKNHRLKPVVLQAIARLRSSFEIKEPPAEAGGVDILRVLLGESLNSLRPFLYLGH